MQSLQQPAGEEFDQPARHTRPGVADELGQQADRLAQQALQRVADGVGQPEHPAQD